MYIEINKKSDSKHHDFIYLGVEVRDQDTWFEVKVWVSVDGRVINFSEGDFETEQEAIDDANDFYKDICSN